MLKINDWAYHTHNVGENSTRWSNKSSNDCHEVVVQHETLSAQGPAGVAVEHGDNDGHVCTTDGHGKGDLSKIWNMIRKYRNPSKGLIIFWVNMVEKKFEKFLEW